MLWIIALALAVLLALALVGFIVHMLFSPWLLLAIIVVVVCIKLRPRRSHR